MEIGDNMPHGFVGPGICLGGTKTEAEESPGGLGELMLCPPKGVNKPHSEADYEGDVIEWIRSII